jgi:hypothetical protein
MVRARFVEILFHPKPPTSHKAASDFSNSLNDEIRRLGLSELDIPINHSRLTSFSISAGNGNPETVHFLQLYVCVQDFLSEWI